MNWLPVATFVVKRIRKYAAICWLISGVVGAVSAGLASLSPLAMPGRNVVLIHPQPHRTSVAYRSVGADSMMPCGVKCPARWAWSHLGVPIPLTPNSLLQS